MSEKHARKEAVESPQTFATVLNAVIRNQYGEEVYEWDPLTTYLDLRADLHAEMAPEAIDRWGAMQVIMTTDAFFTRLDAFMSVCSTLTMGQPFFQLLDPVTVEEAAWGIVEVSLNRELLPFGYQVQQYLRLILKQDGYAAGDYPDVFEEVFRRRPSAEAIRGTLDGETNADKVEAFIDEQLGDLVRQFDRIPSLSELDNIILQRSMDEFVGEQAAEAVQ
jgi:hypothetical protein